MPSTTENVLIVGLGILALAIISRTQRRLSFPPGPRSFPILGNATQIPQKRPVLQYHRWAHEYGDMYYLSFLGNHVIVVNNSEIVNDLLVKRSANYSDRGRMTMLNELMGWDFAFGLMPFGDRWRRHRRMFDSWFRPSQVSSSDWRQVQTTYIHSLLVDLLDEPDRIHQNIHRFLNRVITLFMYGLDVEKEGGFLMSHATKAMDGFQRASVPGAFLVDIVPSRANFKRQASEWKAHTLAMIDTPFRIVQELTAAGNAQDCFVANVINNLEKSGENDTLNLEILRNCAGMGYIAGHDTFLSTFMSFFLAMALHPEVQVKAQEELDKVCTRRVPEFSDRPSLPYIDALCVELSRWASVAPLALPHTTTKDDFYKEYFLPAGTTILANVWAINHDEKVYPEPHKFKPERYLSMDGTTCMVSNASSDSFGFGRRKCAGRIFADAQIFIVVASVLKVFSITSKLKPLTTQSEYENLFTLGTVNQPLPFVCSVKPREDGESLIINREY